MSFYRFLFVLLAVFVALGPAPDRVGDFTPLNLDGGGEGVE